MNNFITLEDKSSDVKKCQSADVVQNEPAPPLPEEDLEQPKNQNSDDIKEEIEYNDDFEQVEEEITEQIDVPMDEDNEDQNQNSDEPKDETPQEENQENSPSILDNLEVEKRDSPAKVKLWHLFK